MQGTMWLQRSGPFIVRQIPPPTLSIDILTLPPCTMRRTKHTGFVYDDLPEVGRKSSAMGIGWTWADVMQPESKLKIRTASSAGASRASCQQGRWRAPRASLIGAEPADWGKDLSLSALVRPHLGYGVCFPEPPPGQDRQGGDCEDAASLFGGARQEEGDNGQRFKQERFWQIWGETCSPRGQRSSGTGWHSSCEFLSLEVSKNHRDETLSCPVWAHTDPALSRRPDQRPLRALPRPDQRPHKGRAGWVFKLWCSDIHAAI